ncbi:lysostaphin resistance A-like protein [Paenibacillus sp. SI8]|uniref:CPBP family intramembrane glutamic endopeptidase n=1 Tax=unclassified Paenibacillus TaxID=185978 RepID=UPI003466B18D
MNEKKGVGKSILTIIGKVLLCVVFIAVITIVLSIIAAVITIAGQPSLMSDPMAIAKDAAFVQMAQWSQIIGFIGGVFISYAIFERRKGWPLGLNTKRLWSRFGEGFLAGVILITASCGLIWLFGGVKLISVHGSAAISLDMLLGFLLFIGVGMNEELFSRGYLQGLVQVRFGTVIAVAVSTILFAFLHSNNPGMWDSPLPIINLLLAGLLFGVSRVSTGGLWMPIGMHLSWNFFQGNVYGFDVSGTRTVSIFQMEKSGSTVISGGSFGAEGSLVTTVILLVGIALIYMYYQRANVRNQLSA